MDQGDPITHHVDDEDALGTGVVDAVAAYTDTRPIELPPLYDAIDPEALEALVDSCSSLTVEFEYCGYTVVVDGQSVSIRARSNS